ncbi:MAG: hypothetical protein K6F79_10690 [Saccharofermentans sp.]|nr:hypothetical protein [Saccharofermentans sp.]
MNKNNFSLYSYMVPGFLFQSIIVGGGYGTICWGFLLVYVIPMLTLGTYKIIKASRPS